MHYPREHTSSSSSFYKMDDQQITGFYGEELQADGLLQSSHDNPNAACVASTDDFTFNTQLASLHSYLGEVDDTRHRSAFFDGGAVLNLPLYHLEVGVVLFPEATLPLRVIEPNFIAAVNRAMTQADALYTMGVVRVYRDPVDGSETLAEIGTTAEIRQYRPVEDGTINVIARGQQRFRLRRSWNDAQGVPCGEVQIIEEDVPFRTPRDACAKLVPLSNRPSQEMLSLNAPSHGERNVENDSEASFENQTEQRSHQSAVGYLGIGTESMARKVAGPRSHLSRAFCPIWVYRMCDSFCLAQKAAETWKQVVGTPSMDGFVNRPHLLSFYIASKIPISDPARQELLEIDGISCRLRREIELLERLDRVRCNTCQTVIARRGDTLAMSADGPLGAYVNSYGYVYEVMTFRKAKGLALRSRPHKEYSWFPGYAWTIINCATCETLMGWLFTATIANLKPNSFWGIRSCSVAHESQ